MKENSGITLSEADDRLVVVHAHPDDETLTMGGTLARLAATATSLTVVTATRGEMGEVIPPELAGLEGAPELGPHRVEELAAAMRALGVTDHRFLGAAGARIDGAAPREYRDSGMQWRTIAGERRPVPLDPIDPASLCAATLDEAVADLVAVLDDVGATAVISYDVGGGYGHPDHVRTAEIAASAAALLGVPYFEILPAGAPTASGDLVIELDDEEFARKRAALQAHRTQVVVAGDTARLSSGDAFPIGRDERFRAVPMALPEPVAEEEPPTLLGRITSGALALAIGAVVGVITTVAHQSTVTIAGAALPLGLFASVLAVVFLLLGMRLVMYDRLVAFCTAMGILAAIGVLAVRSTGGSVLIPANTAGVVWTFAPALIALLVIAWPRLPQSRSSKGATPIHDAAANQA
ncbi:PIG-L family deacetylase [Microbacteriaceae bacterium VKM Ac-2854]|nr:PIG-L family deacetylase [Microbacteriaceae bacterium VKM Ac-2854]